MMQPRPTPLLLVACALVCALLPTHPASAGDGVKQPPQSEPDEIVVAQCRIKLIDQVVLASDRVGILDFVKLREGDVVEKGGAIAGLRDQVARAALAVAEHEATNKVQIKFAKKASEVARVEYDKAVQTNALAVKAVPEVELLRLKLSYEKAELQAEQAEHDLKKSILTRDQANAELRSYRIDAPFSGVVTRVYKFAGEAVQQGDPIVEVVNTDRLRVEGFVDVRDARHFVTNRRVAVQLEIPSEKSALAPEVFEGKIVFVDVSVQPVTRKIRFWADVTNRDGLLRAGLTARLTIKTKADAGAAKVARDAK